MAQHKDFKKYDFGTNCVCIGRISTAKQSHTAQPEDLKAFAKELGYKNIKMFFTTESGFLEYDEKRGWNLVTEFFDSHPDYRVLICAEISRLSRRTYILDIIKEYLVDHKIQLIIKDIHFTLFNEFGEVPQGNELVFSLFGSLAASEMRQKKERTERVLRDNRRLGYSIGGKELFGYDRYYEEKDGKQRSKYRINEREAKEVRDIYRWYAFGIDGKDTPSTVLTITRECKERGYSKYLHSRRNVNKCLKEEAYCGQKTTHNRLKNAEYWDYHNFEAPKYVESNSYVCTYPPIFEGDDTALFQLVQEKLKRNNSKYTKAEDNLIDKSRKHTTILAKLLKCPICGTYLGGEYRIRKETNSITNTYRCHQSRGRLNNCSFKKSISMSLIDSVVWAYCKNAVFQMLSIERRQDIQERVTDIDNRIANIVESIEKYDSDSMIATEDAILRGRTKALKTPEAIRKAIQEYEKRVKDIEKGLNDLKKRKLELEEEKEVILNSPSVIEQINRINNTSESKQLLYKYLHKIVRSIEFVAWDSRFTVLNIHLKNLPSRAMMIHHNEYVCIYARQSPEIESWVLTGYDKYQMEWLKRKMKDVKDAREYLRMKDIYDTLKVSNNLHWDEESRTFNIDGYSFTLEEMRDYKDHPSMLINVYKPRLGDSLVGAPVLIRELDAERLTCYDEDLREK